jgi:hypothetical protein
MLPPLSPMPKPLSSVDIAPALAPSLLRWATTDYREWPLAGRASTRGGLDGRGESHTRFRHTLPTPNGWMREEDCIGYKDWMAWTTAVAQCFEGVDAETKFIELPLDLPLYGVFVPLCADNANVILEHGLGESEHRKVFGAHVHAFPWPVDHEESVKWPLRVALLRTLNSGPIGHRAPVLAHALVSGESLRAMPNARLLRHGFISFPPRDGALIEAIFRARSLPTSSDEEYLPDLLGRAARNNRLPTGVEFGTRSRSLDYESWYSAIAIVQRAEQLRDTVAIEPDLSRWVLPTGSINHPTKGLDVHTFSTGCATASSRSSIRWLATTVGCVLNHETRPLAGQWSYARCPSCLSTRVMGTVKCPYCHCCWTHGGAQTVDALGWAFSFPFKLNPSQPRSIYLPFRSEGEAEEHLSLYVSQRVANRDRDSVAKCFHALNSIDDLIFDGELLCLLSSRSLHRLGVCGCGRRLVHFRLCLSLLLLRLSRPR